MKAILKPFFLLSSLVLTIYVMRHGDISIGSMVKRALQLEEVRPSATLCTGTSLDQVYTQSEIDRAESFKKSLQSMRGGNPMEEVLTEKPMEAQTFIDYFKGALGFIVPWAVMFILSVISAIVITCNWCCIYGCCKNAKCCKCCKEPKDSSKKRIYIFISVIFALAGIGSGIAGIIVSSGVPKGIELTMCSVIALAEDVEYGVTPEHWLGVSGALNSIKSLKDSLNTVASSLSTSTANINDVETTRDAVVSQLNTMISSLQGVAANSAVQRPDPNQGTTTFAPLYMTNLEPIGDSTTMTGMIKTEVDLKYDILSDAQTIINQAITTIKGPPGVLGDVNAGYDDVLDYYNLIQSTLKDVNDYGSFGKTAITGIGAGLTAIFAATLTFSIFAVGAMILVGLLKMKSFNKFLHSSWMGFTLMSVFGFLLSTILYPVSLVLMETCDVVQNALANNATMNRTIDNALDNTVGDIVKLCLTGDGDIITYFGLDDTLGSFKDFNDQFTKIQDEGQMPLERNTPPPSFTLPAQYDYVEGSITGKYLDPEMILDLGILNAKTNGNSCTNPKIYDTWEGNSVNCTSAKGTAFGTSSAADYNLGSPTCIGFDKWVDPSPRNPVDRYGPPQSPFSGCSMEGSLTAENYVESFVTRFVSSRTGVANAYTNIKTQLNGVQTKYDDMANKIVAVVNSFVDIQDQLTSVDAALYDTDTGLFNNMKCTFISDGIDRVVDSLCVGFISSLYQSAVVIIICSVMSFFGAIFTFCLAKRFILQDPNTKPKPV